MILKLVIASLAGGSCGLVVGSGVGIVCTAGPCPMFQPGYSGIGAILGAGVAALAVLSRRPDPRACNRQDPPFPPDA
jgi:hypothetical protein